MLMKTVFWKFSIQLVSNENGDGHAVTIIGFNDNKYGGCFEIMNSWGSEYGDNGFMWIKYDDLASIIYAACMIENYSITENSFSKLETATMAMVQEYWIT